MFRFKKKILVYKIFMMIIIIIKKYVFFVLLLAVVLCYFWVLFVFSIRALREEVSIQFILIFQIYRITAAAAFFFLLLFSFVIFVVNSVKLLQSRFILDNRNERITMKRVLCYIFLGIEKTLSFLFFFFPSVCLVNLHIVLLLTASTVAS